MCKKRKYCKYIYNLSMQSHTATVPTFSSNKYSTFSLMSLSTGVTEAAH